MGKYGSPETVQFKKEHITLLQNANWVWDRAEHGAWCIDEEKPYGSDNPEKDVCDLTGCKKEEALDLHGSLLWILDVIKDSIKYDDCKDYVREEHFKLIKRMYFCDYGIWNSVAEHEFGQISIDQKRPYGNSNVYGDIANILGVSNNDLYKDGSDYDIKDKCRKHFDELEKTLIDSLKLLFKNYKFIFGDYNNPEDFRGTWKLDIISRRKNIIEEIQNDLKNGES
jgi:hypothetical protein